MTVVNELILHKKNGAINIERFICIVKPSGNLKLNKKP